MAAAEPAPRRLQRGRGVSSLQEDRHHRGRDLRPGSIRLAGELLEFQRQKCSDRSCVRRAGRRAAAGKGLITVVAVVQAEDYQSDHPTKTL